MEDREGALVTGAIGPGEDVFVDLAVFTPEIEEGEVCAFGEHVAIFEERCDLALVAFDEVLVRGLVVAGTLVLHAVLFGKGFYLAVAEHGKARKGGHHGADAEVFVAGPKLINRGTLVGIAHEVHVALEDVGIEFDRVLDDGTVLRILLVAQHVHEGAVVDAMHAEGADEVAFEEPEGFSEEEGAGDFRGDTVDDFAPKFVGHGGVELLLGHGAFSAGRD